jgi:hypothetical protein
MPDEKMRSPLRTKGDGERFADDAQTTNIQPVRGERSNDDAIVVTATHGE